MRRALILGLLAGAVMATEAPTVAAQEAAPAPRAGTVFAETPAGLAFSTSARIGVFLDPSCPVTSAVRGPCSDYPVVTGVVEGSPASEAGIRPGDRLVALDGVKLRTEAGRRSLGRLRAGVPVLLQVESDDGRRELRIIPEARPDVPRFTMRTVPEDVQVFRFESPQGQVAEFHFRQDSATDARFTPRRGFVVFSEDRDGEIDVRVETVAPGEEAFVLGGERVAAGELRGMLERLGRPGPEGPRTIEVEVQNLGGAAGVESGSARLVIESAELAERLKGIRDSAFQTARQQLSIVRSRTEELAARGEVPPQVGVGYSYAYQLREAPPAPGAGDGRLAGAEFRALTPELGEYFGLENGLLVLRVIPETPAARLGLRGGDVVVEVGSQAGPSRGENVFADCEENLHGLFES